MRELNESYQIGPDVREVLCKHLLIDWRLGGAYFAEKLLDYEMASNVGNWQWVAVVWMQHHTFGILTYRAIKKFDKDHAYIKNGCQITKHHLSKANLIIKWLVNDAWRLINQP